MLLLTRGNMCLGLFSAVGTLQIMVGLFNIGLGPARRSTHPDDLTDLGAAYWLGAVFIVAGIVSIIPVCRASFCTMVFVIFVNVVASILALTACVLYALDLGDSSLQWMCDNRLTAPLSGDNCIYVAYYAEELVMDMDITLIVMNGIQLCFCIAVSVLAILMTCYRGVEKVVRDVEVQQLLLKNNFLSSAAA